MSCGVAGLNYLQAVTPNLSLGGEAFYLGLNRKSGMGIAGRYASPTGVATFQLASTSLASASFVRKVSEKVLHPSEGYFLPEAS